MTPKRVQQRRTKVWTKPDGAISVARPHKWGNPFEVGKTPGVGATSAPQVGRHSATLFDASSLKRHATYRRNDDPKGLSVRSWLQ
jgi:hypothetical protein